MVVKRTTTAVNKGFTLIELLIVIAILGVLAAAVVIVLNPVELLAQARDGQRFSDLDTIRSALNTYLAETTSTPPNLDLAGAYPGGYCTNVSSTPSNYNQPFDYSGFANGATSTLNTSKVVTGTGWVDVNLSGLPGGAPLTTLPVDPNNKGNYTYCYVGNNTNTSPYYTFKLAARLESTKFATKEIQYDASTNTTVCDGVGSDPTSTSKYCWYQTGTNLSL